MDVSQTPHDFIANGNLVFRTNHLIEWRNNNVKINQIVQNVNSFMYAIHQLETLTLKHIQQTGFLKFSWIMSLRVYLYTSLNAIRLDLLNKMDLLTPSELSTLTVFKGIYHLDDCVFPGSIAYEIQRIMYVLNEHNTSILNVPFPRSAIYISEPFKAMPMEVPTTTVWITHLYQHIPSVLILTNMFHLVRHRHALGSPLPDLSKAAKFLITGSFDRATLNVNNGTITETELFERLVTNPTLSPPLAATPQELAFGIDSLASDAIPRPITVDTHHSSDSDLPPPWLDPFPSPTDFDRCRSISGLFSAFANSTYTHDDLEIPRHTLTELEVTELDETTGPHPPTPSLYNATTYWLSVLITKGPVPHQCEQVLIN